MKFETKPFSDQDISDFIDLSHSEYLRTEGMKNSEFVKWKFTLNPQGNSNYFFFKKKEKVVGRILSAHYPGKLILDKQIFDSFCLSDLLIKKEYRQLSNLKFLYKKCIEETKGVIFHSSNENSEKFYTKILNNKIFFNLISCGIAISTEPLKKYNFFSRILYSFFLKIYLFFLYLITSFVKMFDNLEIGYYDKIIFDKDIEHIRDLNFEKGECFFFKNKDFFEWRYKIYNNVHLLKLFKSKKCKGYVSLIESNVLGLKNLVILDFLFLNKLNFIEKIRFKSEIIKIAKRTNCDTIYSLGNKNSNIYKNILGYPFFEIPDKFLPHSNPMFIHNLPEKYNSNIKSINFTISDFDYF